ncbi:MAG: ATP-binding cassette domain-containing protein [Alphaproteobacteria bacterium]|jgi:iron complex transport system ATP-binding protein|nr:ATP-binding cassette domain-containing protein [Alphaproteobacteria bacterium]
MTELCVKDLSVTAHGKSLVDRANFVLKPGEFVALLGPNGAGKTSLVRAALGLARPAFGTARLDGEDTARLSPGQRARQIAYLPQVRPLAWPSRVRDIVALGRFSHGAAAGRLSHADAEALDHALSACDLTHLSQRRADTLSGGELARVHCARAFAAKAPLLVADEPTAALDPRHQFRILDLVRRFVSDGGGALVIMHDVALAARYASRLIWMKDARILADGPPGETLTPALLEDIYGVRAQVRGDDVTLTGAV